MKIISICISLVLAFIFSSISQADNSVATYANSRDAAKGVLDSIRNDKDSRDLQAFKDWLLINNFDIYKAELGEGFQIFSFLTPTDPLTDNEVYDPAIHVKPTRYWEFILRIDGVASSIIDLSYTSLDKNDLGVGRSRKKNWRGEIYHDVNLAKKIDFLSTAWSTSAGYKQRIIENIIYLNIGLIRVVELSKDGKVLGFIPLTFLDGKIPNWFATAGNLSADDLLDPNIFVAKWRSEAQQHKKMIEKQMKTL